MGRFRGPLVFPARPAYVGKIGLFAHCRSAFQDGRSHRPQRASAAMLLEEKPELQLSFHFRKVPDPCGLRYVCDEESGQSSVKFSHQLVSVMSAEKQVSGWVFWWPVKREGLSPSPLGDAGGIAGSPKWSVMGMCEIEVPLVRRCSCGYRSPEINDLVRRAHFWVSAAKFLWRSVMRTGEWLAFVSECSLAFECGLGTNCRINCFRVNVWGSLEFTGVVGVSVWTLEAWVPGPQCVR